VKPLGHARKLISDPSKLITGVSPAGQLLNSLLAMCGKSNSGKPGRQRLTLPNELMMTLFGSKGSMVPSIWPNNIDPGAYGWAADCVPWNV
jgi:hypothetical protein